jgi:uncharacterized protein
MQSIADTDFEISSGSAKITSQRLSVAQVVRYLAAGMYFGAVLVKAEVVSWFRIQEMFRFQSFHMYGVIGSAVVVGFLSILLIKKFKLKTLENEMIETKHKKFHKGVVIGGLLFGIGWAITGACPGPIFAQIGMGYWSSIVLLLSAIAGTYTYGLLRSKLPH